MHQQLDRRFRQLIRAGGSDPRDFPVGCAEYKAGILLLAAEHFQTTEPAVLATFVGDDSAFIARCASNLTANGIWQGGGVQEIRWWQPYGGIAFIMDILVALGTVRRVYHGKDILYAQALPLCC